MDKILNNFFSITENKADEIYNSSMEKMQWADDNILDTITSDLIDYLLYLSCDEYYINKFSENEAEYLEKILLILYEHNDELKKYSKRKLSEALNVLKDAYNSWQKQSKKAREIKFPISYQEKLTIPMSFQQIRAYDQSFYEETGEILCSELFNVYSVIGKDYLNSNNSLSEYRQKKLKDFLDYIDKNTFSGVNLKSFIKISSYNDSVFNQLENYLANIDKQSNIIENCIPKQKPFIDDFDLSIIIIEDILNFFLSISNTKNTNENDFLLNYLNKFDSFLNLSVYGGSEILLKKFRSKFNKEKYLSEELPLSLYATTFIDKKMFSNENNYLYSMELLGIFSSLGKYYLDIQKDEFEIKEAALATYLIRCANILKSSLVSESEAINGTSANEPDKSLEELLLEINELTGLQKVKEEVNSLINIIKIRRLREEKGLKQSPMSLHLVFYGNPGTGKTTVARILGKIYKKLEVLSKGQLIEVDRSGLVAGYVGQTALKVKEVIEKAKGGILFIDEAYSLTVNKGDNDFGLEAVDTILKAMEDFREDLIIIVAGYPKPMNEFLQSNPGLKSRFNNFIHFNDYLPSELLEIFLGLCKKYNYKCSENAKTYLETYFTRIYKNKDANFANAREVRNVFEKAMKNQANRLSKDNNITDDELLTIELMDIEKDEI
jgi:SpoVK/Ycf46/Vps4 family AAA+-type ATPase